jgi:hypothetical protein
MDLTNWKEQVGWSDHPAEDLHAVADLIRRAIHESNPPERIVWIATELARAIDDAGRVQDLNDVPP